LASIELYGFVARAASCDTIGEIVAVRLVGSVITLVSIGNSIRHTWHRPCSMDFALPHHGQSNSVTPTRLLSQSDSPDGSEAKVPPGIGDGRVRKNGKIVSVSSPV
jgi:hypothetical protein